MTTSPAFPRNKYDLAAVLALHDLDDGQEHRLKASRQRKLFGFAVFGRKRFRVNPDDQGEVTLYRSVLPCDTIWTTYSYAQVCEAILEGRVLDVRRDGACEATRVRAGGVASPAHRAGAGWA